MSPITELHLGDCLEILPTLDADSVDAVVTDPPAGIGFMGKTWDKPGVLGVSGGRAMPAVAAFSRNPSCKRCGGRQRAGDATKPCRCPEPDWNTLDRLTEDRESFVVFLSAALRGSLRVAKPGAVLLCWALPRTSHWTGLAIESAGWQIEDVVSHHFGTGFPKHKSKLKPATESWWLARKPGPKWLGVDACRVPGAPETTRFDPAIHSHDGWRMNATGAEVARRASESSGRWPANLVLSHGPGCNDECEPGCPVRLMGEQSGKGESRIGKPRSSKAPGNGWGTTKTGAEYSDSGTAARFFPCFDHDPFTYTAKASRQDRNEGCEGMPEVAGGYRRENTVPGSRSDSRTGRKDQEVKPVLTANHHPTVKSVHLMRWLCRLACPPGGTILDPFMGSGSTGKAAVSEGFGFVGIEQDPEYYAIAEKRISAEASKTPLFQNACV